MSIYTIFIVSVNVSIVSSILKYKSISFVVSRSQSSKCSVSNLITNVCNNHNPGSHTKTVIKYNSMSDSMSDSDNPH